MHLKKKILDPAQIYIAASTPSATMPATIDNRVYDELEALEAILLDNILITKDDDRVPYMIETVVYPSTGDKVDKQYVCLTLEVKFTPDYPESSPEVFIRNPRGLDDKLLADIETKIKEKLDRHVGNPIIFELVEITRQFLTQCNLPSGQCVICLHNFVEGDVFIKTPCYHHFHSYCLSKHLINSEKYHLEELEKLPKWQRAEAAPYEQTCPVCRSTISFDVKTLEEAPPPIDSIDAPPFRLTDEMKAMQARMAEILARQIARGGVVGSGNDGPPLLTITTPEDKEEAKSSTSGAGAKAGPSGQRAVPSTSTDNAPDKSYRGPNRGFNRRGKPGRRGRGAR